MEQNTTQFDQLMLTVTDGGELTLEQRQFVDLHKQICYNAQATAESFVNFVRNVRTMKEERRYLAAGFDTFEVYAENALGIKQRQAYNYVSIAEKLPESFLKGNASLGVTKLALLTSIDDGEREELMKRVNLKEASTREINAEIRAITAERDEAEKQLSIVTQEKAAVEKENVQISEEWTAAVNENKRLRAEKAAIQKELDETKAQKSQVVYQPDLQTVADLQKAQKRNAELEEADGKKSARISELEEKLKAKEARSEKKKEADLAAAERKLKEMAAELEEAKAKKTTIADDSLLTFKVKFGDLQRLGSEITTILNASDEQTATKLRNAMNAVITKWKEDMKL